MTSGDGGDNQLSMVEASLEIIADRLDQCAKHLSVLAIVAQISMILVCVGVLVSLLTALSG